MKNHENHEKPWKTKNWAVSGIIGKYQAVSGSIRQYLVVSASIRKYPAVSGSIRQYPVVSGSIWQYHVVCWGISKIKITQPSWSWSLDWAWQKKNFPNLSNFFLEKLLRHHCSACTPNDSASTSLRLIYMAYPCISSVSNSLYCLYLSQLPRYRWTPSREWPG